jgi:hypothetical protein
LEFAINWFKIPINEHIGVKARMPSVAIR